MTATLYSISYSPWSRRAEWVLDHCGVPYERREYLPILGEPLLRMKLRRWGEPVSVPALIDGETRLTDSRAIAEWAVANAASPVDLFPVHDHTTVNRWHGLAERMLNAGRTLVAWKTAQSDEALLASLPIAMPGPLRPLGRQMGRVGVAFLAAKYDFELSDLERHTQLIRLGLIALRDAVDEASGSFLLGHLTWADIAMVSAMQVALPASDKWFALDPAIRPLWRINELAREFAELDAWRDAIFAELLRR